MVCCPRRNGAGDSRKRGGSKHGSRRFQGWRTESVRRVQFGSLPGSAARIWAAATLLHLVYLLTENPAKLKVTGSGTRLDCPRAKSYAVIGSRLKERWGRTGAGGILHLSAFSETWLHLALDPAHNFISFQVTNPILHRSNFALSLSFCSPHSSPDLCLP